MFGRESGSKHSYDVVKARLVQHDNVHVAFGDDDLIFGENFALCQVVAVKKRGFIKDRRLGRIYVFSGVAADRATAKTN